jgi:peptidoglycan hydrolase-like protein with peptidoglycan-binding domain/DNA invertase Pin-like site-specific DNA recombinase
MRTSRCRNVARAGLVALACTLVLAGLPVTSIAAAQNADKAANVDDSRVLLARGAGYDGSATAQKVRALQRKLRRLGWQPGPVDGLFGPRTEGAVVRFQAAAGLAADGIQGPRTAKALSTASQGNLTRGAGYAGPNGSPQVRTLQAKLRHAGFGPGPVDGLFGPRTEAAVKRLQQSREASADGIVTPATQRLLTQDRSTPEKARSQPAREPAPDRSAADKQPATRKGSGAQLPLARTMETEPFEPMDQLGQGSSDERGRMLLVGALIAFGLAGLIGLLLLLGRPLAQNAVATGRSRISSVKKLRGPVKNLRGPVRKFRGPVQAHLVGTPAHEAPVWVERDEPAKPEPVASTTQVTEDESRKDALPDGVRALGYVSVCDKESFDDPRVKAQMDAIDSLCERRGWRLLELVRDKEVPSGKALERPGLGYALECLEAGQASCLVVANLRRLSHSVADLGRILEVIGRNGGRLVALDVGVDTATPEGRKAANVLVSVSGWERQRLAERTRQGLEAARAKGGAVGRPSVHDVPALKQWIVELRNSGLTLQAIADRLNAEGVPTLRGGEKWRPSAVQAAAGYKRPPRQSRRVGSEESVNGGGVE